MAQISRPFQIALAAVALLGLVWVVALHGHGGSPSEPVPSSAPSRPASSAPSKPASSAVAGGGSSSTAAAEAKAAAAPTPIYHGAAPGVEGLTRDVAKAHGAVATSQRNAAQLQRSSAQASSEDPSAASATGRTASGATGGAAAASHATGGHAASAVRGAHGSAATHTGSAGKGTAGRPAQQVQVERELGRGETVLLLFWNPKSSVDGTVRSQALAVGGRSKGRVAVHVAHASQVGLFGPVTEVAHVYQTPTILIVNRHGLVSTLTGLTDAFSLEQAVREAERAKR